MDGVSTWQRMSALRSLASTRAPSNTGEQASVRQELSTAYEALLLIFGERPIECLVYRPTKWRKKAQPEHTLLKRLLPALNLAV